MLTAQNIRTLLTVRSCARAANNRQMRTCIRFCTNACTSCLMVEEAMEGGWGQGA